jgi:hypothetical protein
MDRAPAARHVFANSIGLVVDREINQLADPEAIDDRASAVADAVQHDALAVGPAVFQPPPQVRSVAIHLRLISSGERDDRGGMCWLTGPVRFPCKHSDGPAAEVVTP